mmetsp:Transcript_42131/g.82638  ORF Transcript_42131/g.82638 Transcript_42131/m.82638 type:complete len:223 (+) Transcript_42131:130-798(+)|eukprot:CAMPEP_0194319842 /NCGR_PEP_ID=MMETSP0171-20130528/16256_1 /TAXON_ID=218684 /ORGANISM="Corethron pennatum, Strain L29A3" /LENGTH=222 /DNA_ID=CAMNT_0039077203 /DNA_START=132 /DNA_END=800 /DNA_ORIENTATION=+
MPPSARPLENANPVIYRDDEVGDGALPTLRADIDPFKIPPYRPKEIEATPPSDTTDAGRCVGRAAASLSVRAALGGPIPSPAAGDGRDRPAAGRRRDLWDPGEVYRLLRSVRDPEHPDLTLGQLRVVRVEDIAVEDDGGGEGHVSVEFTPTVPHCSMATLIGLALVVTLVRSLPPRFRFDVAVKEGTHTSAAAISRQLYDKERVCAALENKHLLQVVDKCLR